MMTMEKTRPLETRHAIGQKSCPLCGGPMLAIQVQDSADARFTWYRCRRANCPGWIVQDEDRHPGAGRSRSTRGDPVRLSNPRDPWRRFEGFGDAS